MIQWCVTWALPIRLDKVEESIGESKDRLLECVQTERE